MKLLMNYALILLLFVAAACGSDQKATEADEAEDTEMDMTTDEETTEVAEPVKGNEASAVINSASGSEMTGLATFIDNGDGSVTFKLMVEKATKGEHAVHLHEKGDCSADDATSAGGHWNPESKDHGKRGESGQYHAGDVANLSVAADGMGSMIMTVEGWNVGAGGDNDVIGKAVIIHAKADDFTSQPSGAAGARVGCGVVEMK